MFDDIKLIALQMLNSGKWSKDEAYSFVKEYATTVGDEQEKVIACAEYARDELPYGDDLYPVIMDILDGGDLGPTWFENFGEAVKGTAKDLGDALGNVGNTLLNVADAGSTATEEIAKTVKENPKGSLIAGLGIGALVFGLLKKLGVLK